MKNWRAFLAGKKFWAGQGYTIVGSMYALSDTLTVPTSEPIPEPSTLVLFGLGFLGILGYVYRRKRRLSD
ncbi:PEP-CTERM sorting domain-containing protein [bacterium]|nr:PEP-CTERM sorting domain-containing protein [bacterium]